MSPHEVDLTRSECPTAARLCFVSSLLVTMLLGCATPMVLLPTTPFPDACRGIGLDATLEGSPDDPKFAWLTTTDGVRRDLVWPAGYKARFNPKLEVLSEQGVVEFRQGDVVRGACRKGPTNDRLPSLLIRPGDLVGGQ